MESEKRPVQVTEFRNIAFFALQNHCCVFGSLFVLSPDLGSHRQAFSSSPARGHKGMLNGV